MTRINGPLENELKNSLIQGVNELGETYQAVQMLPELRKKYPGQLRQEIISVRIYQTEKACYLEITEDENPGKFGGEIIKGSYSNIDFKTLRTSLSFITEEILGTNEVLCFFRPSIPILDNAFNFIEKFDDNSKLNCTNLFSEEGAKELYKKIYDKNNI